MKKKIENCGSPQGTSSQNTAGLKSPPQPLYSINYTMDYGFICAIMGGKGHLGRSLNGSKTSHDVISELFLEFLEKEKKPFEPPTAVGQQKCFLFFYVLFGSSSEAKGQRLPFLFHLINNDFQAVARSSERIVPNAASLGIRWKPGPLMAFRCRLPQPTRWAVRSIKAKK